MDTLLSFNINEEIIVLFLNIVPAIIRLIKISGFHAENFLETLKRVKKISLCRIALYASIIAAHNSPEKRLVEVIDAAFQECQNTVESKPPQDIISN